jgi:hypothetical protein
MRRARFILFIASGAPPHKKAMGLMKKGISFYSEVLIRRPQRDGNTTYRLLFDFFNVQNAEKSPYAA